MSRSVPVALTRTGLWAESPAGLRVFLFDSPAIGVTNAPVPCIDYLLLNRLYIKTGYRRIAALFISISKRIYKNVETEGIKVPKITGMNDVFDTVVRWMVDASTQLYQNIELNIFEKFNMKLGRSINSISEKVRHTQTGLLSYNVLAMLIGLLLLLFLVLLQGV